MIQDTNITNYITINRRFFNHSFWGEHREYSKAEAWLDLLQSARFEVSEGSMLIGMNIIKWSRGEMPASIRYLVNRWNWSIGKVSRFLDLLKQEKMIATRQENGQTVIIICNYNQYNFMQKTEQQPEHPKKRSKLSQQRVSEVLHNSNRNTDENTNDTEAIQERYETNKDNKDNKEKKEERRSSIPSLDEVIVYFKEHGYTAEHAKKAFEFYDTADWFDSKGNKVLSWKQKMLSVWFKEDGKCAKETSLPALKAPVNGRTLNLQTLNHAK